MAHAENSGFWQPKISLIRGRRANRTLREGGKEGEGKGGRGELELELELGRAGRRRESQQTYLVTLPNRVPLSTMPLRSFLACSSSSASADRSSNAGMGVSTGARPGRRTREGRGLG